jgi:hypothetical protein
VPDVKRAKTVYCEPLKEWVTLVAYDDGVVKCPTFEKMKQGKKKKKEITGEIEKVVQTLVEDYEALIRAEESKA